jgi:hypothetical protein
MEKNTQQDEIRIKDFCSNINKYLNKEKLDVELNILLFKEYKFNFETGKFYQSHKNLLPVINGIGNINILSEEERTNFRKLNIYLYSDYINEICKTKKQLKFKLRYTPISRHYIAGDIIKEIKNIIHMTTNTNLNLQFQDNNYYSLLIFTTPLHFNYNAGLIDKLKILDNSHSNLKVYLIFLTPNSEECDNDYLDICNQFFNFYSPLFQNLKFSFLENYKKVNQDQYKLFNLDFDLSDPTKMCFFINKNGLILSDFVELTEEIFDDLTQTLKNDNDDILLNQIKSKKRYNYNNLLQDDLDESKISNDQCKKFEALIKNFHYEGLQSTHHKLAMNSNNNLTIQIRKYFNINKNSTDMQHKKVEKITFTYALSNKLIKVYESFISLIEQNCIDKSIFQHKGYIINHKTKLNNVLETIKNAIVDEKIDEAQCLSPNHLSISLYKKFDMGITSKFIKLNNRTKLPRELNEEILENLLKINKIEKQLTHDKKSLESVFQELNLIPKLTIGDQFININNIKQDRDFINNITFKDGKMELQKINSIIDDKDDCKAEILVLYFFAIWSKPAVTKMREIAKLSQIYSQRVLFKFITIDSTLEETIDYAADLLGIKEVQFYFGKNVPEFEIYQKLYSAYQVNNNLVVVDITKSGKIINSNSQNNFKKESLEFILQESLYQKQTDEISETDWKETNLDKLLLGLTLSTSDLGKIKLFYINHLKQGLNYKFTFNYEYSLKFVLDNSFNHLSSELEEFKLISHLREREFNLFSEFLQNGMNIKDHEINNHETKCKFKIYNNIMETIDLNHLIHKENELLCRECKCEIGNNAFYLCHICQICLCREHHNLNNEKHEHNLIYLKTPHLPMEFLSNIDSPRLGSNLQYNQSFYSIRSRNHRAACNLCGVLIQDKARFICLNCNAGIVSSEGFYDVCESCIEEGMVDNIGNAESHDTLHHIYLRLDYAISYFEF